MLELNHINISFNSHVIFSDAHFLANTGELTVLSGKSGTGKSTLIDALLCKHHSEYKYNDAVIHTDNSDEMNQYIYHNVSIVYQQPCFFEELTIKEHINLMMDLYGINEYDELLLESLGINDLVNKFPKQLSGGEQTRCSLFLSVLKHPAILVLDEPTASLDKDNKDIVISFIQKYAHDGHIVIASTHDQALIEKADVLYTIDNNKLIKEINNENIIKHNNTLYIKIIRYP